LQRIAIALVSVPATVVLAVALFTFNALVPDSYAALLRFADWLWQASLNALSAAGDTIPGARKLANAARQGVSGHHYVIMALCSMVASFRTRFFVSTTEPRRKITGTCLMRKRKAADRLIGLGRGPATAREGSDYRALHELNDVELKQLTEQLWHWHDTAMRAHKGGHVVSPKK
jgi:hypothetical protein